MDRWAGKVAVVTGSSSGIGLATSIALVREGMIVIGLARRKALMEEKVKAAIKGAKGKFYGQECDISIEQNVIEAFQAIKKNFGTVHVLVNNAGVAISGAILETSSEIWQQILNVNVLGLLYCTREAVKLMKESNVEGHVVNINSILGHKILMYGGMKLNVYPASKHAVTAITESLQLENLGDKIRYTSISPGVVNTEITEGPDFKSKLSRISTLEVEDIANAVIYVVGTPHRVQIHELTIRSLGENPSA